MADPKKVPSARQSASGKYMEIVLQKQMHGFHVALSAGGARAGRTVVTSQVNKQVVKTKQK